MPAIIAAFALAGCGGSASAPVWRNVEPGGESYAAKFGLSADLPAGWTAYEDKASNTLLLTRHSMPFDFIRITRHGPLPAFLPHTGISINAHKQTYEIAEMAVNSLRAAQGVFDLTVEELSPTSVAGAEGFSLLMSYSMENAMRRRCMIYGFVHGGKYYTEIGLYALEEHYFGAVIEDFIALVKSVRVN
jgi:hypothetical protein